MRTLTRPVFIGQAPGPNTMHELPLFPIPATSAGGRLQHMMGVTRHYYLTQFDKANLLPFFPGRHKRDDKFPMADAKLCARAMQPLLSGRVVVLVGRNVANAFELEDEFHQIRQHTFGRSWHCTISVVPHPSGRNHWYNDTANRDIARLFWRDWLEAHAPELPIQWLADLRRMAPLPGEQEGVLSIPQS